MKIKIPNPLDLFAVADSILGRFLGDADKRQEVMGAIRIALANRTPQWAQGVAVVVSVVGLNLYLLMTVLGPAFFDKFVAWQFEVVVIWFLLIAMLYGEKLGDVIKMMKSFLDLLKERAKERGKR